MMSLQYVMNIVDTVVARVYEGEYPTLIWYCVTRLYGGHDLCNDIHKLEVSLLAICGHVARL